jgi:hypothetical protein
MGGSLRLGTAIALSSWASPSRERGSHEPQPLNSEQGLRRAWSWLQVLVQCPCKCLVIWAQRRPQPLGSKDGGLHGPPQPQGELPGVLS